MSYLKMCFFHWIFRDRCARYPVLLYRFFCNPFWRRITDSGGARANFVLAFVLTVPIRGPWEGGRQVILPGARIPGFQIWVPQNGLESISRPSGRVKGRFYARLKAEIALDNIQTFSGARVRSINLQFHGFAPRRARHGPWPPMPHQNSAPAPQNQTSKPA